VLVTLRRLRYSSELAALLRFSAPGIPLPLYLGMPDQFSEDGENVRREHLCVVDDRPPGLDLVTAGQLTLDETIELGVSLCNTVTGWAASRDGVITRGLRPETIFMSGSPGNRTFSGATPRPFFLLGNDGTSPAYPRLSFDPPAASIFEFPVSDAVFTIATILWYAFTGAHPYVVPGGDVTQNVWIDRRAPFAGPQALGQLLEGALIAEPSNRVSVDVFRNRLLDTSRGDL
jgi:hypothetical protein